MDEKEKELREILEEVSNELVRPLPIDLSDEIVALVQKRREDRVERCHKELNDYLDSIK